MSSSSADIMNFEMRSKPFCRPKLQTMKPAATVTPIHKSISPGLSFRASNTPFTAAASIPSKVPVRNLKK